MTAVTSSILHQVAVMKPETHRKKTQWHSYEVYYSSHKQYCNEWSISIFL